MSNIGKRLKEARNCMNIHQSVAAEKMGMSRPTLSAIETDKRQVTTDELVQFAELYKVEVGELLYEAHDVRNNRIKEYYKRFAALPEEKQKEVMHFIDDIES